MGNVEHHGRRERRIRRIRRDKAEEGRFLYGAHYAFVRSHCPYDCTRCGRHALVRMGTIFPKLYTRKYGEPGRIGGRVDRPKLETTPNDWYSGALAAANSAAALYDTVSIQIVSADGSVVYNSGAHANFISPSLPENERNTASAPIVVDGEQVGTVFVRVFGSQTLLTQADQDFRNKSYQAMIFASLFSVLVAILAGFILARLLSRPINSITNAARALKEGNYSARTHMVGDDEIARLGKTFDQMADSVEAEPRHGASSGH